MKECRTICSQYNRSMATNFIEVKRSKGGRHEKIAFRVNQFSPKAVPLLVCSARLPYRRSSLYMINYMQFKQNNNRY